MLLVNLAPFFILFEMVQLVVVERYIGIKQIRSGEHPMENKETPPDWLITLWIVGIIAFWVYMVALLFNPWGNLQGFIMLTASIAGGLLRRALGFKWALVIMTIVSAIRMGLLANMLISVYVFSGLSFTTRDLFFR